MRVLFSRELSADNIYIASRCGLDLIGLPFIHTEQYPITSEVKSLFAEKKYSAWVVTSVNAAGYAANLLQNNICDLPKIIFAVGSKSAAPFHSYNIPVLYPEKANADSLADLILSKHEVFELCYFKGNITLGTIEQRLGEKGVVTQVIECYATKICPIDISPDSFDAVVFYSPSSVHSYVQSGYSKYQKKIFAIGQSTATAVRNMLGVEAKIPSKIRFESIIECILSE